MKRAEELEKELFLQKQAFLFQDFIGKVKTLMDKNKLEARRCFISYAWEDESTPSGKEANEKLQGTLERLADDLKKVNVEVFLDVKKIQGNLKKCMQENVKRSDYLIVIGTPRYKERVGQEATNVAFEFKEIRRKIKAEKEKGRAHILLPLLYSGDFGASFPKKVMKHLIRDIRDPVNYYHVLVGNKKPLGLVPHMYPEFQEGGTYHLEYQALWQSFSYASQPVVQSVVSSTSNLDPLETLKQQATAGNALAQNSLGEHYYHAKRYEQAFECFMKAALQNDPTAQFNVGNCFYNGQGIGQNYRTAVEWYTKAGKQGEVNAQNMLGNCYKKGKGAEVPKNLTLAFQWFLEAAKRHHSPAQFNVGACYQNGEGTPQNYSEATQWYEKAAKQDHTEAQYFLGICYEKGWGVPQDYQIARELHEKATAKGHAGSKKRLEEKPELQRQSGYSPTQIDYIPKPVGGTYPSASKHMFFSNPTVGSSTTQPQATTEIRAVSANAVLSSNPVETSRDTFDAYRPNPDAIDYSPAPQKP